MDSSMQNTEPVESVTTPTSESEDELTRQHRRMMREGTLRAIEGLNKLAAQKRAEREAQDRDPSGPPPSAK